MILLIVPCAPITNDCSISLVFEGPAIKTPYLVLLFLTFEMPSKLSQSPLAEKLIDVTKRYKKPYFHILP